MTNGSVLLDPEIAISSTPRYPIRGHQLGYRAPSNTYDSWSLAQFEQYIRDLALFGANAIELLPQRTNAKNDSAGDASPFYPLPPDKMIEKLSAALDAYGMNVWIWWPFVGDDSMSAEVLRRELGEREKIFARMPRLDAVFVPGSDPGELHPDKLFPFCAQMAAALNKHHPKAKIWISPQNFRAPTGWLDSFYAHVRTRPDWLGGVVFGPWVKTTLPEMRDRPVDNPDPELS